MNKYTEQEAADFYEITRETLLKKVVLYRKKFSSEQIFESQSGEWLFSESGLWILSTILSSPKAIQVHIELIRTVVKESDFSIFDLLESR